MQGSRGGAREVSQASRLETPMYSILLVDKLFALSIRYVDKLFALSIGYISIIFLQLFFCFVKKEDISKDVTIFF